jgi:CDP-diacylglycerol--serine O-phosphatidyltransferase
MKPLRPISMLPTLFTLGNLVCGFFAIVVASRVARPEGTDLSTATDLHNVMLSGWLIMAAMVFDALDGHIARLARSTSDFGAQLDSLCDVVSFGIAPAFLLVKMCPDFAYLHREPAWIIAAAYAACAAMRLARFNVETGDEDDHLHFSGLPSPAAAGSIAGFAIILYTLMIKAEPHFIPESVRSVSYAVLQTVLPFFALVVALLMVSRVPYPHVVNQVFRGRKPFGLLVKLVFFGVALALVRGYAVPIVFCLFALGGPARLAWERIVQRRHREEPVF